MNGLPSLTPRKPLGSLGGAVPLLHALAIPSGGSAFESKLFLLASTAVMGSPRRGAVQDWGAQQIGMLGGVGPPGSGSERARLGEER